MLPPGVSILFARARCSWRACTLPACLHACQRMLPVRHRCSVSDKLQCPACSFTGIFDRENGGGFLTDHFPKACKVCSS